MVCNKRNTNNYNFKLYGQTLEIVKLFVYLGATFTSSGSFKLAIARNLNKATRAYYSLLRDFNHYSGTKPKVLKKLFESMVVPILLYGCEVWAIYGWRKQTTECIKQHLFTERHNFEKLQAKMCKAALGLSRFTTGTTAKAEMGTYPLFGKIIQQTMSYQQHILSSSKHSLIYQALSQSIDMDRCNITSFYSRIKNLLETLNTKDCIYPIEKQSIKKTSVYVMKSYQTQYEALFFNNLPKGKHAVYSQIKRSYLYEKYLNFDLDNSLIKYITSIRLSSHCLPVEKLRKQKISRNERFCNLCDTGSVGDEFHVMAFCTNTEISRLRNELLTKITEHNQQFQKFAISDIIKLLLIANDKTLTCIFAVFLKKMLRLVKCNYQNS